MAAGGRGRRSSSPPTSRSPGCSTSTAWPTPPTACCPTSPRAAAGGHGRARRRRVRRGGAWRAVLLLRFARAGVDGARRARWSPASGARSRTAMAVAARGCPYARPTGPGDGALGGAGGRVGAVVRRGAARRRWPSSATVAPARSRSSAASRRRRRRGARRAAASAASPATSSAPPASSARPSASSWRRPGGERATGARAWPLGLAGRPAARRAARRAAPGGRVRHGDERGRGARCTTTTGGAPASAHAAAGVALGVGRRRGRRLDGRGDRTWRSPAGRWATRPRAVGAALAAGDLDARPRAAARARGPRPVGARRARRGPGRGRVGRREHRRRGGRARAVGGGGRRARRARPPGRQHDGRHGRPPRATATSATAGPPPASTTSPPGCRPGSPPPSSRPCRPRAAAAVWRAVRRDAPAHPSPNTGVAEAAFAAALGLRLGGESRYGDRVERAPAARRRPPADRRDIGAPSRLSRDVTVGAGRCSCVAIGRSPAVRGRGWPVIPPAGPHGGDGAGSPAALGLDPATVLDLSCRSTRSRPTSPPSSPATSTRSAATPTRPAPPPRWPRPSGVDADRVAAHQRRQRGDRPRRRRTSAGRSSSEPEFSLHPRGGGRAAWRIEPAQPVRPSSPAPDERAGVWDEAFYPLADRRWTRGDDGAVVVGSLTKVFACPGLRLGYVLADDADRFAARASRRGRSTASPLAALPELLAAADLAGVARRDRSPARTELVASCAATGSRPTAADAPWVLVEAPGLRDRLAPAGRGRARLRQLRAPRPRPHRRARRRRPRPPRRRRSQPGRRPVSPTPSTPSSSTSATRSSRQRRRHAGRPTRRRAARRRGRHLRARRALPRSARSPTPR